MWYVGISKIGSTKVMVYMYLVPLFAVIFAAVTIGEQINMMQLVGGLIIFIGLYVVKKGWNSKASSQFEKSKLTIKKDLFHIEGDPFGFCNKSACSTAHF